MNKAAMIDKVTRTIEWASEYLIEYEKQGHDFDPFRVLMNEETQQERLFGLCVNYLHDIEELTDTFRDSRLPKSDPVPAMGNTSNDYMKKPYKLLYIYDGLDEKSFTLYETGNIEELESEILAQENGDGNNISEQHIVIDAWDYHDSFDDFDELIHEYITTADKVIGAYFGSVNG
jgi:hypothetical protein